ncbi:hypothetical protein HMPREF1487_05351 [Pseudomonas sp. HPB0071]|uniref:Uncharacterized protein n=2 Tax=Pseudomonas TaxID=286 RepID=A0A2X2CXD3_PSELU|nr:hypothetical protein HMPREF1487_05351 [Pseudomonas sp. HPB0071]SEP86654.1 hypothetical protein SAMN05216409_102385 [Pseudomonas lutea]SHI95513.1 hypothetical protein SAMN05216295_105204 [Pseudomonas zeshuii]SPZ11553.1 Uncharacterised protein [Pseudomonas luteola]
MTGHFFERAVAQKFTEFVMFNETVSNKEAYPRKKQP